MIAAQIISIILAAYFSAGILFALWFVTFRIGDFDPAARGTGIFFRFLIFFGAAAMWIVIAAGLIRSSKDDRKTT